MTWVAAVVAVALLGAAAALAANWREKGASTPASSPMEGSEAFRHVHGLGVDPADGVLYVATHHGVFRVTDSGAARVGDRRQDTMGFIVIGPNEFLASGHPAPGEDGPAHLGLMHSGDAGRSWQVLSLGGKADFHLLRVSGGVVYGLDSTSSALMATVDRTSWQTRSRIAAYDLVVDPNQPDILLAATEQGISRSDNGGRTWSLNGGPRLLQLYWSPRGLLAVVADGTLLRSTDSGASWTPTGGRAPAAPAALAVHDDVVYLATEDGRLLRSGDVGLSWQPMQT
ncbi:F510_1955 family glycosylhydrolase [Micromonospora sp. B11E3]|uniref:F510_1955 family glycosylhydrolase n=1 Tax=Micromonospora sp. B11E3 TaxID=3153562 RepID=UPI00325C6510